MLTDGKPPTLQLSSADAWVELPTSAEPMRGRFRLDAWKVTHGDGATITTGGEVGGAVVSADGVVRPKTLAVGTDASVL
ncbi:hypothetical protein [Enhygromyxa salina]|uniref:Uncharacterized protein n=1 Tax=Enhygromyxa salina TaxID=215803 RepID=A0A2S9YA53_9BACT|nr:hypothetical protein [Enhygromyxa salina]PRQ01994.1 hypothetical protein ENSA7_56620 [Enhygromyxa salina]